MISKSHVCHAVHVCNPPISADDLVTFHCSLQQLLQYYLYNVMWGTDYVLKFHPYLTHLATHSHHSNTRDFNAAD